MALAFGCGYCQQLAAQNSQSTVYDAVTILNVEHGVNALIVPIAPGYFAIDPLTGTLSPRISQGSIMPGQFLNEAATANKILIAILRRNSGLPDSTSDAGVIKVYANNPFLKDILTQAIVSDSDFIKVGTVNMSTKAGATGANLIGNFANGTANFLIKRAEDELAVAIFSKLKAFLARYPEFNILFPQTCSLIAKVESYDFSNILTALEGAIQADLKGFVSKISSLYQLPKYQALNKQFTPLTLIFAASTLINNIDNKANIAATLSDLGTQAYLKEQNNYAGAIELACLLSNSIRDNYLGQVNPQAYTYVTADQINAFAQGKLADLTEFSRYYLGLLYQKLDNIHLSIGTTQASVQQLVGNWLGKESAIVNAIAAVGTKMKTVDSLLTVLKVNDEGASLLNPAATKHAQRYALYAELAGDALQLATPFIQGSGDQTQFGPLVVEIGTYWTPLTTDAINMVNAFDLKQYDLAIQDLGKLLGTLSKFLDAVKDSKSQSNEVQTVVANDLTTAKSEVSAAIIKVKSTLAALPSADPSTSSEIIRNLRSTTQALKDSLNTLQSKEDNLQAQLDEGDNSIYNLGTILKYAGLLASISQAQNGQQVEELLESTALPAGSSRIKKVTDFNIAVNAYVGGFTRGGMSGAGFTNRYGLTAPIGFTFSHGWGEVGSVSLFAGVFDIGNVIQYKLNNQGAYEQNISLAGIVSPSIQLAFGLPWYLPITVGAGWQWTSPVTNTTNNIQLSSHFNAFIGVDIPLFNLVVIKKK